MKLETDKVSDDIQIPVAGVTNEYFAEEDDTIEVGTGLRWIEPDAPEAHIAEATP